MSARNPRLLVFFIVVFVSFASLYCQTDSRPLTKSELLALVAGNTLSENIIHEVQTRGVAFRANDAFKAQLSAAGADANLLTAVAAAKPAHASDKADSETEIALQNQLSAAGRMMRAKQYEGAIRELTSALQAGAHVEAGFVMGDVLRRQEVFDLAANVYQSILREDPGFPEVHTKLAYIFYRTGDLDGAMREASGVLVQNPHNAEAHKNLGLALLSMSRFDGAIAEFREALRIKGDYAAVHLDLGLAFDYKHDAKSAIEEYRKANALEPDNADAHFGLALALKNAGDIEGAIREYREAKRIDPERIDVRHNLSLLLIDVDILAAVREFHELVAMAPDFELGHIGLGMAVSRLGHWKEAETEYHKAMELDPSDPIPHSNLGYVFEQQQKDDAAMSEFVRAAQLDDSSVYAHAGMGRVYLRRKDYQHAVAELRRADALNTSFPYGHRDLGEALAGTGDMGGAITQMRLALSLSPQDPNITSKFAPILEKNGDFNGALEQYRLAAEIGKSEEAKKEYAAAMARLKGKVKPSLIVPPVTTAATSTPVVPAASVTGPVDEKTWRATLDASFKALQEQRLGEAEASAKTALAMAEKSFTDQKLIESTRQMAWVLTREQKYNEAREAWQSDLTTSQKIEGPESQEAIHAMEGIAGCAFFQKDYATATSFYVRAIELNEKLFGSTDMRVMADLHYLANAYQLMGAYAKAEPIRLQLLETNSARGGDGLSMRGDLLELGKLYLDWGKFDKAETFCRKSLAEREKAYGEDSPLIADSLQMLSDVLTKLGKNTEAAQLKKRHDSIVSTPGGMASVNR
ncbi:MAG: tetratricopeptide repeat protein [Candidatus Angelobacter sp.]